MKFIDEYRDSEKAQLVLKEIYQQAKQPVRLMEVCGTHTVSIARFGLRKLLPQNIELVSGPGCPVCVTSQRDLDKAIALAQLPQTIITTFGDMMRVPGSNSTLTEERAAGRKVRVVYSPLDALLVAQENRDHKVIFLGVGFETTAPTVAATLLAARQKNIKNFEVLSLHKTIPHALKALLDLGEIKLNGFLLPGHVSAIIGAKPYEFLAREYGLACVISGFEPLDILQSILLLLRQINMGQPQIEIQYRRGVRAEGNQPAQEVMREVFEPADVEWRGLGMIPHTGLKLRKEWAEFDAALKNSVHLPEVAENKACRCGDVLRGVIRPAACPLFAKECNPQKPMGPCMVSSEGSCGAAFKYELPD
ncbi:MAG: hydrogenase formation protein HypD [bacterium]